MSRNTRRFQGFGYGKKRRAAQSRSFIDNKEPRRPAHTFGDPPSLFADERKRAIERVSGGTDSNSLGLNSAQIEMCSHDRAQCGSDRANTKDGDIRRAAPLFAQQVLVIKRVERVIAESFGWRECESFGNGKGGESGKAFWT